MRLTGEWGLIYWTCYGQKRTQNGDNFDLRLRNALPARRRFACIIPKRYSDKNPPLRGGVLFLVLLFFDIGLEASD